MMRLGMIIALLLTALVGCDRRPKEPQAPGGQPKVRLALNWKPEPEFGGIYAAQQAGAYKANGVDVEIMPGGAGAPTWQMVGSGAVEFGIASADEVIIARARGADIVALFAIYQTNPQGIMVHKSRGLNSLADVFSGGTLAIEKGLPYTRFFEKKYGFDKVKLVTYDGGIAQFLADLNFAQQCFVTSEPISAARQGSDPQVFLVADSGYNPYTAVLIARKDYVDSRRPIAEGMVKALRQGWEGYLKDPAATNQLMAGLNKTMDLQTFAEAAKAQEKLIRPEGAPLGSMTLQRWKELTNQLRELKVIEKEIPAEQCFVNLP